MDAYLRAIGSCEPGSTVADEGGGLGAMVAAGVTATPILAHWLLHTRVRDLTPAAAHAPRALALEATRKVDARARIAQRLLLLALVYLLGASHSTVTFRIQHK